MKKILLPVLTLLLLCGLVLTVSAAAPGAPVIHSQFPDCSVPEDAELTLFSDASSPDGGTLEYQWYSTTVNEMAAIQAVIGAEGESYRVPDFSGTRWFCYAVWNVNSAGEKSAPVYSRLIRVERYEEVTAVSLEIRETPTKVVYAPGECLDLTGLKVRVYTADGYFDSLNGDKLEITKNPLVTVGYQKIRVAYQDAFDVFIVEVREAPHTHAFGEWMVLTEPTCTEEGIRLRECDCGAEEREGIPAAGHTWDEGTVTAEATAEQDGEMTFTCTVCGETRTEAIPAGEIPVEPTEDPASSEPSDSRVPTEESEAPGRQPSEPDSGFPWWILAAAVIAIGIAAAIFIIISRKKK